MRLLLNEQGADDFDEEGSPLDFTRRAVDALDSFTARMKRCDGGRNKYFHHSSLQELQVTIRNDHGISLLMKGDSVGALRCFREAAKHLSTSAESITERNPPWLLLPTYFNLSLLLLRDGHAEESAKSWLGARGHLATWRKAARGDGAALRRLRDLRLRAVFHHAMLAAKRSMWEGPTWDREAVAEWTPPVAERGDVATQEDSACAPGGVDAAQVTALDVLLLQCAKSDAEIGGRRRRFAAVPGAWDVRRGQTMFRLLLREPCICCRHSHLFALRESMDAIAQVSFCAGIVHTPLQPLLPPSSHPYLDSGRTLHS